MTKVDSSSIVNTRPEPWRARRRRAWSLMWPATALLIMFLATWWVASEYAGSAVFASPAETFEVLVERLQNTRFQKDVWTTVRVGVTAYVAVVIVGGLTGLLLGMSPFWSRVVLPLTYAFDSVPKIVFFPIFLVYLGLGDASRGAFAFVAGVVPMFLIATEAVSRVPRTHLKLAASLQLSRFAMIRKILLPTVTPSLAAGARMAFGSTLLALIIAELFAGSGGLGNQLLTAMTQVRMDRILATVVVAAVIALVPAIALRAAERHTTKKFTGEGK
ncbi:ABC transporter permease subunit (plasmid) [Rhodococcus sp. USK10]|uniref:ABC transporter permease n=1 Tax=Rhodococcus sp. USK10 TaxID=2789739 RepID=UPI001C5E7261|nr:ABC transporter permease subunit [Rhodococcus sp. USK10]QYB00217.1 ABC transporter permease subunit [Rhodococcus sp. USK10]